MIRTLGLDHVAINVKDLKASLDFYTKILGLQVTDREYSKPGIEYFLDCGSSLIGLIQGESEGGRHLLKDGGIGGNHIAFRVSKFQFDKVVEELRLKKVEILFHKKREKSWSCYFLDPDGNKLEITAWPEEG